MRTIAVAALAALLVLCAEVPARAQHGPPAGGSMRTYTTAPVGERGADAWRADLAALADAIRRLHPEPDWRTPAARFDSAVVALHADVPRLAAHEIVVAMARIVALVGDGHTSLPLYFAPGVDFHILPYRLGIYEDGVRVEAADRSLEDLVGGRVVSIGGVPIEEAIARVVPLISRDNDNWIAVAAPHFLNRIEVLHALGLASDLEGAALAVDRDGAIVTQRVPPLAERHPRPFGIPFLERYTEDWVDARELAGAPAPLHQQRFHDLYWWQYLPESDLLYVKFDQVQNRPSGPTALAVFQEAMAFARENPPGRTVIDLRNNTGGEGGLLPPIVREIVRTREIDEPGRLFVVIGKRTFSAGQMLVAELERLTTAVLVGEPSSAFYNGYAGHVMERLPNSGIVVSISPHYYQMSRVPDDRRRQATPRLAAVPTFADYAAGRDPALEVILAWDGGALAHALLAALAEGDTARAMRVLLDYDEDPRNRFGPGSAPEVNALAYERLRAGRVDEALALFRLNVRAHPEYANGWDSLGEALVQAGRRDEAIAAFRRALAVEPGFPPAREWLRRLGADGG